MNSENDQPKAWEKRDDESNKAFAAFCVYRDMGVSRSVVKAYVAVKGREADGIKKPPRRWELWASVYEWVKRAQDYDLHLELEARKEREAAHHKELEEYRERQKKLAQATTVSALNLLQLANAKLTDKRREYDDWKAALAKESDPAKRAELVASDPISNLNLSSWIRAAAQVAQVATDAESQALAVNELLHVLETNNP